MTVVFLIQALVPAIVFIQNQSFPEFVGNTGIRFIIFIFGFGIYYIGLLIGFRWEALGGLLSLLSLLVMYLHFIVFEDLGEGIWLLSIALLSGIIPGFFYLLSWNHCRKACRELKK